MSYKSKAKRIKRKKSLRGKITKKLLKQSQLWKSRLKRKPTRRKPIVKMTEAEQKKYNSQIRIDDRTNRHQMLGAVIALALLAFTFIPIIPESYVNRVILPGQTVNYPNAVEGNNIKLPENTVDSSAADHEDGMIITEDKEIIVKEKDSKEKITSIIKEAIPDTPKKAKRFALFQIVKLLLGVPIIPGS